MHYSKVILTIICSFTVLWLSGCAVNPVTGESQLMIISEAEEIKIGQEQYAPAQQSQGGQFYLDPELTFYLKTVGNKLAQVSDRPDLPYEFVVLNNSVPNAWALPSGKIAVNRGLLIELDNEAQLAAVLGHEIVHAAARHSAQRMQQGMLANVAVAGLGMALGENEYAGLVMGGAALGAKLTMAKYGRDHELESDHYGMKYMSKAGYDLNEAVTLQEIFVRLSEGRKSGWLDGLFASHPPSPERVEENRKTAQDFPPGNFKGTQAYQTATAYLRKTKPAYDAHDKALNAAQKKNYSEGLELVNSALRIEPNEAMFYALRGDIYQAQGNDRAALKDYDKAVALYPELFSNYLKRGQSNEKLGNDKQAESDYAKSNTLLPTALATLKLGTLAVNQGNTRKAQSYFSQLESAQGVYGDQARLQLAQIELPDNPSKYLKTQLKVNRKGEVLIAVVNQSGINVQISRVETILYDSAGNAVARKFWSFPYKIKAGERSPFVKDPVANPLPKGYKLKTQVVEARLL
ncbi:M48 family peptidase [Oleiphilus messinensis]|uniref:M48 family peptidase n=1 Tax=Oleiphilus messinensis TaxID=141451 RepID=A0A1Y0IDN8_9GAMM|nr:M48 family metalloprotease [Oleiphilus messinensis]ARU57484.1 M48 family peptidase [Oleiphilus messinensis]